MNESLSMRKSADSLSYTSMADALADALRVQVLDGVLAPGAVLTELQLAAEFNVARPTAKSAITALVHEGLLRRRAHRPAYVPRLSAHDILDIYLVRIPLELEVSRRLAVAGEVPAAAIGAINDLASFDTSAPHSRFVAADLLFHRLLVDAVGSPRLSRVYRHLQGEIHLCMVQSRTLLGQELIVSQHRMIFRALQAGDGTAATEAMQTHLVGARDALVDALGTGGHV